MSEAQAATEHDARPPIVEKVKQRFEHHYADRTARRLLDEKEAAESFNPPDALSLEYMIANPPAPLQSRIDQWHYKGSNTTVAAPAKTGKTTLSLNRAKSLLDGDPFLGEFEVVPLDGTLVLFNYEVGESQYLEWVKRIGIKRTRDVFVVNLRGRGVWLQDDTGAEWAVNLLRSVGAEAWEVDPFSAAFRGNPNAEADVSPFLSNLDRIKHEAGVEDLFLTTHTGHQEERTAGSHRLLGWPDALWVYVRDDDGTRYLRAEGRDIDVSEAALAWQPSTGLLSWEGGGTSRHTAAEKKVWRAAVEAGEKGLPPSFFDGKTSLRSARNALVEAGLLEEFAGTRKSGTGPAPKHYRLTTHGHWAVKKEMA